MIADCGPISTEHVKDDDAVALRASGTIPLASERSFQEDDSFVFLHDTVRVPVLVDLLDSDSGNEQVIDPGPRCSSSSRKVLRAREDEEEVIEIDPVPEAVPQNGSDESKTIPRLSGA